MHGISLARYLKKRKRELVYREMGSFMRIKLKITSCLLVSGSQLEQRLESCTGRKTAILVTVGTNKEVTKLCSKRLKSGEAFKIVKKYWESGSGLVCLSCTRIRHNYYGK